MTQQNVDGAGAAVAVVAALGDEEPVHGAAVVLRRQG